MASIVGTKKTASNVTKIVVLIKICMDTSSRILLLFRLGIKDKESNHPSSSFHSNFRDRETSEL